jgi:hypothetical protein
VGNTQPVGVAYADPDFTNVTVSGTLSAGSLAYTNLTVPGTSVLTGSVTTASGIHAGSSGSPIPKSVAADVNEFYTTSTHTTGSVRSLVAQNGFGGPGGGDVLKALASVAAAQGAGFTTYGLNSTAAINVGGGVNSTGTIAAIRGSFRLGAGMTNPGSGTLAAIQANADFASGATLPATAAYLAITNTNTGSFTNLMNVPAAMVATKTAAAVSHTLKIVDSAGTAYYLMVSDTQ